MGAFDTYVYNMQDPDDDCVAWKPELAQILNDGNCFDILLDAYHEAQQRIAELEAREVNLSKLSVGEVMHMSGFSRDYAEGWCAGNDNAIHEIRTAGIKVKGSDMATLTKQEKPVKKLNKLLAECPSNRIAFATTGDCEVSLFDVTRYDEIFDEVDKGKSEFIPAAMRIGAAFNEYLTFPNQVESTAG